MVLIGMLVSMLGIVVMIVNIRYHYKEAEGTRRKRWFETMFFVVLSALSEVSYFYLGLLLLLFGLVLATGLI